MSNAQFLPISILSVYCTTETEHNPEVNLWIDDEGIPIMSAGRDGRLWPSFLVGVLKHAYSAKRKDFTIGCEVDLKVDESMMINFKGNRKDLITLCQKANASQIDAEPMILGFTKEEAAKPVAKPVAKPMTMTGNEDRFIALYELLTTTPCGIDVKTGEPRCLDGRSWKEVDPLFNSVRRVYNFVDADTKLLIKALTADYRMADFLADIRAMKTTTLDQVTESGQEIPGELTLF